MPVLEVEGLVKKYKYQGKAPVQKVLHNLSLSVDQGELVAVMGPSGSGKTTLLNIIGGLDTDYSGAVKLADIRMDEMNRDEMALFRRRRIGFIFQDYNLLDSLTLQENVMLPLVLDKQEPDETKRKTAEVMTLLGIDELKHQYPYMASGGQQQRAGIARAIIHEPEIILADEPTGNLDSAASTTVMEYFAQLHAMKRATIVLATHDPVAASYCSRVILIKDGTISKDIRKTGERKSFFAAILQNLAVEGGKANDV